MNRRILTVIAVSVSLSSALFAGAIAQAPEANPSVGTLTKKAGKREHHPEMHKALKALEHAKMDLEHATKDFGGHRVKAIQAVDQAIAEVHEALKFDKK